MTRRQRIWIAGLAVALAASIVLVGASVAYGQETTPQGMTVEIPIETTLRGDPGELFAVGEAPAAVGVQCVAELEGRNNESVHPDSDILVEPITFTDVENGTFQAAGLTFISDGTNQVFVRLGADGVFSAGFLLEVTCNPPNETTTTVPGVTTTTVSTSTTPPTTAVTTTPTLPVTPTTLSSPPVGGVDTGGGACADGACDDSLSPVTTWLLISGTLVASSGLVWAYFRYTFGDTG